MPTASITSTKTGQTFEVDFTDQPTPDDIDEVTSAWETQFYQREGLDPSIAEQSPVGTVANQVRNVGPGLIGGLMAQGGRVLDAGAKLVEQGLVGAFGVNDFTRSGGGFQDVANVGDNLIQAGQELRPTNPANPIANTVGSGLQQATGLVATMGMAAPFVGTKTALTTVPLVQGAVMGGGEGVQTARDLGIESPAGQLATGAAFAGAEVLTERLTGLGNKAATEALQAGLKAGLGRAAKTAVTEGLIEEPLAGVAQDLTTRVAGEFVADPNRPGYTVTGVKLPELDAAFWERRKMEAIGGLAGGAVFGGLQLAASGRDSETGRGGDLEKGSPPPLPVSEDLGELTAEDVADLEPEWVGQTVSDPIVRPAPILTNVPDAVMQPAPVNTPTAVPEFNAPANIQPPVTVPDVQSGLGDIGATEGDVTQGLPVAAAAVTSPDARVPAADETPGMAGVQPAGKAVPAAQPQAEAEAEATEDLKPWAVLGVDEFRDRLSKMDHPELRPLRAERDRRRQEWQGDSNNKAKMQAFMKAVDAENRVEVKIHRAAIAEALANGMPADSAAMQSMDMRTPAGFKLNGKLYEPAGDRNTQKQPRFQGVLWGKKDSMGGVWLKLSDNVSDAEMKRRQAEGWTVERLSKGLHPDDYKKAGFKNLEPGGKTAGFVNAQILAEAETLIRDGITDFANWSRAMVTRFGQAIRQYLQGIWQQVVAALPNDAAKNVRLGGAAKAGSVGLSQSGAVDIFVPKARTSVYAEASKAMKAAPANLSGSEGEGAGNGWNRELNMSNNAASALSRGKLMEEEFKSWLADFIGVPEKTLTQAVIAKANVNAQNLYREYHHVGSRRENVEFYDPESIRLSPKFFLGIAQEIKSKTYQERARRAALKSWQDLKESLAASGDLGTWSFAEETTNSNGVLTALSSSYQSAVRSGKMTLSEALQGDLNSKTSDLTRKINQENDLIEGFQQALNSITDAEKAAWQKNNTNKLSRSPWEKKTQQIEAATQRKNAFQSELDAIIASHPAMKMAAPVSRSGQVESNARLEGAAAPTRAEDVRVTNRATEATSDSAGISQQSSPEVNPESKGFKNLEPGGKTAGFVNGEILAEAESLIRDGFTDFANWSRAMVTRFGQAIRQYLQGIWQQVVAALPNDAAKNVRLGRPAGGPVRLSAAGALDVGPTAGKGVLGTVADGQVITAKVPNLEQASHANIREIASAGQEDGAKDFRYNPQTQTVYWGRLSSVSEAERQKVADWLTAEGYKVTGHKATTGNDANYREAHGLPGKPAVKLSQGGFVAGPGKVKETQSRFASPDEQERLYQVREDVTVKAAAEAWVDSMPMEQAVAAMEAGRLPADMTGDVAQHAAGLLIQRTTEMMKSGNEVVQMQARSLGHRISKVWQGWLSQEAGRNLRQRSVVNSELTPYAPILAAEGMLIDRADAVMDKRFDGGAEGGATKVNELVKKVDEQTSAEIGQAVEETMVNAPPTDPVVAAAAVKAVTNAARAYFGGSLPPRVKILHQESAEWDARLNGEVLELNAAALETSQVIAKIEHEIGHLLFRDPSMQSYFAELWAGLDVSERAQIENITAALYDAQNRNEEASVRALDSVRQLIEANNPTLWQRFVSWVQRAWERFTGRLPRDPRRLAAVMIETGVARLRGEAGNQTEVRESRRSSLLKVNSPALVKALNALRGKMYPGVKWADIFMELPASQKERQREIYRRLMLDERLKGLTKEERLALTNELDKAWQQERRKVFLRELGRVGIGEKAVADKAKVVKALPKLIRLINLGMMNSDMFREAIAPEYGLKQITTGQALTLRKLAEEAYALPEGVLRSRKLAELLDGIQKSTGTGLPEVLNQYWVAAVLSGMRTQFDTFMSVTNGFGNQLIQSGMLAIKNGNRAAAMVSMLEWWRGLKQAFPEAMQILAKGDYSYLKRFNEDLKKALEGETTFRPVPLGEALWRDGNAMEKYGFAPVMIWTGRLMAAADHLNNSATTAGAKVVARALHPELYKTVAASQSERDAAAAQARREVTGGAMPATAQERATVAARTREILNGQLRPEELGEASFMGDQAAYQNDPTGVFGGIYRAVNQGLGSLERGLQAYAEERGADGPAGQYARGLMLFLSGAMRSMMGAKFIRFGANFGNDMLGYVPGTVLTSRALLGKEATASQRQLLMGKNVFGLMAGLTVAAMFLGKDDEEEGWHLEGPWTDLTPEEVKQRRAAGFEPLTFWKRTEDKVQRVSYKQWPTAGLLAGVAHMQDRQRFRPEKWAKEGMAGHLLAAASVGAFQVKDVSAMRGLADLLGASKFGTNPEDALVEKMSKVPVNFAGGFIPTLVKDLDALADPRRYKPATVMEEFLRNVPLLRQRVAGGRPEINILGLPIEQDRKPWSRAYTDAESGAAHAVLGSLNTRGFTLPTPETNRKVWKAGAWTTIAAMGADAEWRYQKKVGDAYRAWLGSPEGAALLTNPDGLAVQRLINRQAEVIKLRAVAGLEK